MRTVTAKGERAERFWVESAAGVLTVSRSWLKRESSRRPGGWGVREGVKGRSEREERKSREGSTGANKRTGEKAATERQQCRNIIESPVVCSCTVPHIATPTAFPVFSQSSLNSHHVTRGTCICYGPGQIMVRVQAESFSGLVFPASMCRNSVSASEPDVGSHSSL